MCAHAADHLFPAGGLKINYLFIYLNGKLCYCVKYVIWYGLRVWVSLHAKVYGLRESISHGHLMNSKWNGLESQWSFHIMWMVSKKTLRRTHKSNFGILFCLCPKCWVPKSEQSVIWNSRPMNNGSIGSVFSSLVTITKVKTKSGTLPWE